MSFDVWDMLLPKADKYGQKVGKVLPGFVKGLYARVKEKFNLDWDGSVPPELQKWIPEIIEALAGGAKLDRHSVPFKGKLGDEVCEYANEFINAMGLGASEKLTEGEGKTKPDPKAAAKTSDKDGGTPADPKARLGFVLNGRWYPANCSHVARPFTGKGNKAPDDITLEEALARNHSYCRDCVRDLVPAAAKSDPKPAAKTEEPKIPEPECKLAPADHTLFDLWERLRDEDEKRISEGEFPQYAGKFDQFVQLTNSDPELFRKFFEAFHGRGTYEQFRRLVIYTDHKNWGLQLETLLGKTKAPESTMERERRETNAAIAAFTKWLKDGAPKRKAKLDERKLQLEMLRAKRTGDKKKLAEIQRQLAEIGS